MAKKKESYEDKIKKLEEILSQMENSDLTLDESMTKYEEGIKLYKELYKLLGDAEGKIKILNDEKEVDFIEE
ncbi:exodeoxyribonuclease VII small subunit [Clostridium sp.]|uniref:exodeoxyribonuclease VII small subunit n=1 Tax=Clostridium sp. TaxID=1506 RepID=UPI002FCB872C